MSPNRVTRKAARGLAETKWFYGHDGEIVMRFHNLLTDAVTYRSYKTESAAKAAETRFHDRLSRVYAEMYS